jgi:hypothetical protein
LEAYTKIRRHTKDLDLFILPSDCSRALSVLTAAGYAADVVFSHWLAKVFCGADVVDLIFNSGNGLCPVDETWFAHGGQGELLDTAVTFCPVEEMIWQKAFIMERERFDGADVAHLFRARGPLLDWPRLLQRFGPNWRVLLAHLALFAFIYPAERGNVPPNVTQLLLARAQASEETNALAAPICRGTLLSREQYLVDIDHWGYCDVRSLPPCNMTSEQLRRWTNAIEGDIPTARSV